MCWRIFLKKNFKVTLLKRDSNTGSTTDDMVDYVRPVTRKEPDIIIMHFGTNDLTKGVNTMSKVRKIVSAILEVDSTRNIQLCFSRIAQRAHKDYSKEIKDINTRMKSLKRF